MLYDSELTKKLNPKGSNPGKVYDLIKLHKNNIQRDPLFP